MSSPPAPAVKLLETHPNAQAFTLRQVAEQFHVSVSTIRRYCVEGKLASIRTIGQHRRIPEQAVEALAAQLRAPR